MSENRLLFLDIKPKSNSSASVEGRAEKPLWTHSEKNFRFNFFPEDTPTLQREFSPSDITEPSGSQLSFPRQVSAFAFNFQIPTDAHEEEMTTETSEVAPPTSHCAQDENSTIRQEGSSPTEPPVLSKTKRKKKSGKKKAMGNAEKQQESSSAEGFEGGGDTELSAEEQLIRQLDWCINHLELGMSSQKVTTKHKEEAFRALKTLRSSKAPLAKKRQVMRAMTGDYRKKMEEEQNKQFKLIQGELALAQFKPMPDAPKKSVFHRRADVQTQKPASDKNLQQPEAQDKILKAQSQEGTSAFVFTESKEEFRFNFM